jgi:hypothetical protein
MRYEPSRLRMNYDILAEVVGSYYRNLKRFKEDQGIEWADRHKSGGFMIYWICRLKPVQILVFREDAPARALEEVEILVNELFAVQIGISCLNVTSDLIGDFGFFYSLIQRLREHECPPAFLSSMLYLYERTRLAEQKSAEEGAILSLP